MFNATVTLNFLALAEIKCRYAVMSALVGGLLADGWWS